MLKPVKLMPTELSDEFLARASTDLAGTMSFILLGHPVELTVFEAYCMPVETYLKTYRRKSVLINIQIEGDNDRKIYAFFDYNSSILMGGIMRQIQEGVVKAKIDSQDFSGPIRDAFGEIANQFTGSLDRIIRSNSLAVAHLIVDFKKHVYPDEAVSPGHFVDNEEYIVWIANLTIQGHTPQKITILFPQSFYEQMIGQRIKLHGITQKRILLYSWDKSFARLISDKIESRHFSVQTVDSYSDMVHLSKDPNCCLICIDFGNLASPISHDLRIFAKRMLNAKIPDSIPMWVSMTNPNQEVLSVLEKEGLKGTTIRDSKKDLLPWIQENIAKIPIQN